MTAKDKQKEFLKSYLKPRLKEEAYRTSGQTWWKIKDDFFLMINLQNSQWNSKDELSFCFNIGVGLLADLKDGRKPTHFDMATPLREDAYLSGERNKHKYRKDGWLGYLITDATDLNDFIKELEKDFELDILPKLRELNTLEDCLKFYGQFEFWGENLQKRVKELKQTSR